MFNLLRSRTEQDALWRPLWHTFSSVWSSVGAQVSCVPLEADQKFGESQILQVWSPISLIFLNPVVMRQRSGHSHSNGPFCLNPFKPQFQRTTRILLLTGLWRMGEIWGLRARARRVGLLTAVPRPTVSPPSLVLRFLNITPGNHGRPECKCRL